MSGATKFTLAVLVGWIAALELGSQRHALRRLDPDEKGTVAVIPSLGGLQRYQTVTQSGLYHLILLSRKPVAKRFRKWITSEVLPQIAKYGSYLPGATPAERVRAFWRRWKQERRELLLSEEEKLTASGLLTVAAFRVVHGIESRDALSFARQVGYQAGLAGVKPRRFFREGGMRSAWPKELLFLSLVNFQPKLNLGGDGK